MSSPLESLSEGLRALAARSPLADVEHNVRALVAQALTRLDLVSRAEFDAQARVLARTREKLAALEARVAALESARGGEPD